MPFTKINADNYAHLLPGDFLIRQTKDSNFDEVDYFSDSTGFSYYKIKEKIDSAYCIFPVFLSSDVNSLTNDNFDTISRITDENSSRIEKDEFMNGRWWFIIKSGYL